MTIAIDILEEQAASLAALAAEEEQKARESERKATLLLGQADALRHAITMIRTKEGIHAALNADRPVVKTSEPSRTGQKVGTTEAIMEWLSTNGQGPPAMIADAIEHRINSESKNRRHMVRTTLFNLAKSNRIRKIGDNYALLPGPDGR